MGLYGGGWPNKLPPVVMISFFTSVFFLPFPRRHQWLQNSQPWTRNAVYCLFFFLLPDFGTAVRTGNSLEPTVLVTQIQYIPILSIFYSRSVIADLAQWANRLPHKREVGGSKPTGSIKFFFSFLFNCFFLSIFYAKKPFTEKQRLPFHFLCLKIIWSL